MNTPRSGPRDPAGWTRRATLGGLVSLALPRWTPADPKAFDPRDVETSLRLQIFLDRQGFGPGKVDGKPGEFTRKALDCYNTTIGLPPGDYSAALKESENLPVWTNHRVTEADFTWVDTTLPVEPPEQAKRKFLPYRSHLEYLAERYHTDEPWLRKSNPKLDFAALKPGDVVRVPNVVPFAIESLPRPHQWSAAPAFARRTALVDTNYKFACIFEENRMIAAFPVTPGEEKFIHRGDWKIVVMQAWPNFRWDKSMLEAGQRSNEFHMLPPGPNSPVGVLWAGLNRSGIGLHGTAAPETIGRSRSAGCIRLANWDAVRLPNFLRPGCAVVVR